MKRPRYADIKGLLNVSNLQRVREWFDAGDVGFDRVMTVMGDNRDALAHIYGPRHQTYTSEFRFDVWRIPHDGLYFWVLSAKTKGTSIEVEAPDVWGKDFECIILTFLDNLYVELKELENKTEELS